jgi:hypothetical protein
MTFERFTEAAGQAVTEAGAEAARLGAAAVTTDHLRLAIYSQQGRLADYEALKAWLPQGASPASGRYSLPMEDELRELLQTVAAAAATSERQVTVEDLTARL